MNVNTPTRPQLFRGHEYGLNQGIAPSAPEDPSRTLSGGMWGDYRTESAAPLTIEILNDLDGILMLAREVAVRLQGLSGRLFGDVADQPIGGPANAVKVDCFASDVAEKHTELRHLLGDVDRLSIQIVGRL